MASPAAAAPAALLVLLAAALAATGVVADGSDHRYKANELVPLYANKVGPFHNPR
jgi:transmembrane 9 superfamily protein 1